MKLKTINVTPDGYYAEVNRIVLGSDVNTYEKLTWGYSGFPSCCAMGTLTMFRMNSLDQNYGLDWVKEAKKFFALVDLDPEAVIKKAKAQYRRSLTDIGGVTFTLTRRKSEQPYVDKLVSLMSQIYDVDFVPVFTVRSNHANYPVTQYVAVLREYKHALPEDTEAE